MAIPQGERALTSTGAASAIHGLAVLQRGIRWSWSDDPQTMANRIAFLRKIANNDTAFATSNQWHLLDDFSNGLPAGVAPSVPGWF